MRTLAIGDVHGCFDAMLHVIAFAGMVSAYFAVVLRKETAAQERNLLDTRRGRVE